MPTLFYEEVFIAFNRGKVKYCVADGVALNLQGIPRFTADLDLIISLDERNVRKCSKILNELGYRPKIPVNPLDLANPEKRKEWKESKNMRVLNFWSPQFPYREIDIFIENPIDFEIIEKDKEVIKAGKLNIPVVSLTHLIRLKKLSRRKQDLLDLEALEKLKRIRNEEGKF